MLTNEKGQITEKNTNRTESRIGSTCEAYCGMDRELC